MKRATQCGLFLLVFGCAGLHVWADAVGDYKVILDRNPFGLKPPPPPPKIEAPAPPETPTKYKLSGITALFNPPRAMFVNEGIPGKPEYLSLSEGQRQGSLEVLAGGINLTNGAVRVKISGEERTLSFEKDGLKPAVGPPVMTAPGVPIPRFGLNPVPSTPGGTMVPPPNAVPVTYNNAPMAIPTPVAPGAIPAPGVTTAYPSRTPRSGGTVVVPIGNTGNQPSPPVPAPVDPVKQTVQMEVNRAVTKAAVASGQLPPLPPTDLTGR